MANKNNKPQSLSKQDVKNLTKQKIREASQGFSSQKDVLFNALRILWNSKITIPKQVLHVQDYVNKEIFDLVGESLDVDERFVSYLEGMRTWYHAHKPQREDDVFAYKKWNDWITSDVFENIKIEGKIKTSLQNTLTQITKEAINQDYMYLQEMEELKERVNELLLSRDIATQDRAVLQHWIQSIEDEISVTIVSIDHAETMDYAQWVDELLPSFRELIANYIRAEGFSKREKLGLRYMKNFVLKGKRLDIDYLDTNLNIARGKYNIELWEDSRKNTEHPIDTIKNILRTYESKDIESEGEQLSFEF